MLGAKMATGGVGLDLGSEIILMHMILDMSKPDPQALNKMAPMFVQAVETWRKATTDEALQTYLQNREKSGLPKLSFERKNVSVSEAKGGSVFKVIPGLALNSEYDYKVDIAALASQRSITRLQISDEEHDCKVLNAAPDGECAFSSTRLFLQLQGQEDLAVHFTREKYVALVKEESQKEGLDPGMQILIDALFERDGESTTPDKWAANFGKRWLEEVDFNFLSRYFNIRFRIYYCTDDGLFRPEMSYEGGIYQGVAEESATVVTLAHVSTMLISRNGASLNHFDALIIDPTAEQAERIGAMNGSSELSVSPRTR